MKKLTFLICVLAIPTFGLMLRQGVYTMHDFHVFRQFEFNKCIQEQIFPCRWAPDAGLGYGEPLFNFYGQLPYWIGEMFHLVGFSIIDSVKLLFMLSLVLSGLAMYFVSSKYWGKWGGLLSAIVYVYAPYRAVDVWVRGALSECLAFVLFPIIFYCLDRYLELKNSKYLIWLSLALAALVTIHNLSFLMFIPFMGLWWLYKVWQTKRLSSFLGILLSGLVAILLAGFYLLPVIAESSLVTVSKTTQGYYDYRAHFATLNQLFISRFWGYGASLWGPVDDMSFSVGQTQWLLLALTGVWAIWKRKIDKTLVMFMGLSGLAMFLTHNKSQFIWNLLPPLSFVQFPWRFLGLSGFFLSLSVGFFPGLVNKWIIVIAILAVIVSNYAFFRWDIWRPISDEQQFSGQLWDEQRASALQDFWPKGAPEMPVDFAPMLSDSWIGAHQAKFLLSSGEHQLPIVYFPGWRAFTDEQELGIGPSGKLGLITVNLDTPAEVRLTFTNTWPRTTGNVLSIIGIAIVALWAFKEYSRN